MSGKMMNIAKATKYPARSLVEKLAMLKKNPALVLPTKVPDALAGWGHGRWCRTGNVLGAQASGAHASFRTRRATQLTPPPASGYGGGERGHEQARAANVAAGLLLAAAAGGH